MDSQTTIALIALLTFSSVAFGYWLGGSGNAVPASDHDDTEHGVGGTQ